jgi:hypothetical protein
VDCTIQAGDFHEDQAFGKTDNLNHKQTQVSLFTHCCAFLLRRCKALKKFEQKKNL